METKKRPISYIHGPLSKFQNTDTKVQEKRKRFVMYTWWRMDAEICQMSSYPGSKGMQL